jgi:hypothetical protein
MYRITKKWDSRSSHISWTFPGVVSMAVDMNCHVPYVIDSEVC